MSNYPSTQKSRSRSLSPRRNLQRVDRVRGQYNSTHIRHETPPKHPSNLRQRESAAVNVVKSKRLDNTVRYKVYPEPFVLPSTIEVTAEPLGRERRSKKCQLRLRYNMHMCISLLDVYDFCDGTLFFDGFNHFKDNLAFALDDMVRDKKLLPKIRDKILHDEWMRVNLLDEVVRRTLGRSPPPFDMIDFQKKTAQKIDELLDADAVQLELFALTYHLRHKHLSLVIQQLNGTK